MTSNSENPPYITIAKGFDHKWRVVMMVWSRKDDTYTIVKVWGTGYGKKDIAKKEAAERAKDAHLEIM